MRTAPTRRGIAVLALALAGTLPLAHGARAQEYFSEWPAQKQPLLEGRYRGLVRDGLEEGRPCEYRTATLELHAKHRYTLRTRCDRGKGEKRVATGGWSIDEIAGSCLILTRGDAVASLGDRLHGFRIGDDAATLMQDGGDCTSADERDRPMILKRDR